MKCYVLYCIAKLEWYRGYQHDAFRNTSRCRSKECTALQWNWCMAYLAMALLPAIQMSCGSVQYHCTISTYLLQGKWIAHSTSLHWGTQVCRGDLEADPPGPAFYNRPTIAADIFTTPPPTKLYLSLFWLLQAPIPTKVLPYRVTSPFSCVPWNIAVIKICQCAFVSEKIWICSLPKGE